jgi:hypothetical protein
MLCEEGGRQSRSITRSLHRSRRPYVPLRRESAPPLTHSEVLILRRQVEARHPRDSVVAL